MQIKKIPFQQRVSNQSSELKTNFYKISRLLFYNYLNAFDLINGDTKCKAMGWRLIGDILCKDLRSDTQWSSPYNYFLTDNISVRYYNLTEILEFAKRLTHPQKDNLAEKYRYIILYKILVEPFLITFDSTTLSKEGS